MMRLRTPEGQSATFMAEKGQSPIICSLELCNITTKLKKAADKRATKTKVVKICFNKSGLVIIYITLTLA